MPKTIEELRSQLRELLEDNRQLQLKCAKLEASIEALEQVIGESNLKLISSDMTSLELEQVFSACTDALWVLREDGVVVRANEAMLQILGKSEQEIIGQKCSTLIDYALCETRDCPIKRARNKTQCEYDIRFPHPDDTSEHYILTTAPLVTIDGTPGIVGQFKNITIRKQAEERLEQANAALERMAHVDGLTQIANRRCFDETLQREWSRLSREQKPLSLLMGDIDYFKKFNDHYGHQAGDDCLRQVAMVLSGAVMRPADLVARYGGEEFVVLLPDTDHTGAAHIGSKLLKAVAGLRLDHQTSDISAHVTISLGIATHIPQQNTKAEDLIEKADQALYRAKENGRNRCHAARETGDHTEPTAQESVSSAQ